MHELTRTLITISVSSGLLAGYGYLMRFMGDEVGSGSLATLGAPIGKRAAPYCLGMAVITGLLALVTLVL